MAHDQTPELIERDMLRTRESLTDKVAALENQVIGTLQSATTAVQDTVESVKTAVSDTQASVKQAFDVSAHTRERPWAMVGGAAVVGLVAGLLISRRGQAAAMAPAGEPVYRPTTVVEVSREPRRPDLLDELLSRASQELRTVATEALTTCSSSLKQQLHYGLPKLFDHVGAKLTGEQRA